MVALVPYVLYNEGIEKAKEQPAYEITMLTPIPPTAFDRLR